MKTTISSADFCKPVQSDNLNWFTTGDVTFDNENWVLGQPFYVPIVRLTDDAVKAGISKFQGCSPAITEKYIGSTLPNLISTLVAVGQEYIESINIISVDSFSDLSLRNITIGARNICNSPQSHDCTFDNSLILEVKTRSNGVTENYKIKVGIENNDGMKALILIQG
jgi:hypothetical protein